MNRNKRVAIGATALIFLGSGYWFWSSRYEDTDNAYTAAHVAELSSKVAGLVNEVLVEENTKVKRGDVLLRIDRRDYENALNSLTAQLGGVEASLELARKDVHRANRLFAQKAIPEQERDDAQTKVQELGKREEALRAQIAQAELNLEFTEVRAPEDGTVGKKIVEPGMVVSAGEALLSFVDSQAPWVVANFKETQLRKMRLGQKVQVEIDSIGGKRFAGEIESFAPGTGATFALIPPDNATGNFTKIVQRVPVRIRFEPESIKGYEDRIIPGLSAEATVHVTDPSEAVAAEK